MQFPKTGLLIVASTMFCATCFDATTWVLPLSGSRLSSPHHEGAVMGAIVYTSEKQVRATHTKVSGNTMDNTMRMVMAILAALVVGFVPLERAEARGGVRFGGLHSSNIRSLGSRSLTPRIRTPTLKSVPSLLPKKSSIVPLPVPPSTADRLVKQMQGGQ